MATAGFVVQRYGPDVAGGAESACRQFAIRLGQRGHEVHVITTCARDYTDWANVYPAGETIDEGVTVHRFPVDRPRDNDLFNALNPRLLTGYRPVPLHLQHTWMEAQGPHAPALAHWLADNAASFDFIDFFTYLYWTTWAGLPAATNRTTTVLHPCAHDEPPLYLPMYSELVRRADAVATFVQEEAALLERRFHLNTPTKVHGIGIEFPDTEPTGGPPTDRPYLLYVGRVDPHKGSTELFDYFVTYKARNPGPLALVVVGDPVLPLDVHPDVISTGFVDEDTKRAAMRHALALVHPSYFESFSLVLCEAWVEGTAALVQGRCDVLAGQARRSGGAIPYIGFAEFEAAVDRIWADPPLRRKLGDAGRRYVEQRYQWNDVLDQYEAFVATVTSP